MHISEDILLRPGLLVVALKVVFKGISLQIDAFPFLLVLQKVGLQALAKVFMDVGLFVVHLKVVLEVASNLAFGFCFSILIKYLIL